MSLCPSLKDVSHLYSNGTKIEVPCNNCPWHYKILHVHNSDKMACDSLSVKKYTISFERQPSFAKQSSLNNSPMVEDMMAFITELYWKK